METGATHEAALESSMPVVPEPSRQAMLADFLRDVLAQPAAMEATVASLIADGGTLRALTELRRRCDSVVLAGMGTSHAALYPLELRLTEAGLPTCRWEAS